MDRSKEDDSKNKIDEFGKISNKILLFIIYIFVLFIFFNGNGDLILDNGSSEINILDI